MNIVTIMNYDWSKKQSLDLCYTWIKQCKIWLSKYDTVYVYSLEPLPDGLKKSILSSDTCVFKSVIVKKFAHTESIHFGCEAHMVISNHNFLFKLYNTTQINFPFLFMDCDAFIVGSIDKLNSIFETTKDQVFFLDHEPNIPTETSFLPPFINSGVFIMNDPKHLIYNWDKIYRFAMSINFIPRFHNSNQVIPGTDQSIIKSYLDHIKYDYSHKNFTIDHNTAGSMINEWYRNKENKLQTTLKNDPSTTCKIVHYWGKNKNMLFNSPLIVEEKVSSS